MMDLFEEASLSGGGGGGGGEGLPVGFLFLWFSVLCTVESLSLLYLLFIY